MSERSITHRVVDRSFDWWFAVTFLVLAVGFPLLYRGQPFHFDEAIFLTISEQIAEGRTLYVTIADHKPPAIFALGALAFELFEAPLLFLRLLTYLVTAITAIGVFVLGRDLRDRKTGMVASVTYLLICYLPHFDGFFYLTEPFAALTLVTATYFLFDDRAASDAVVGASLGVGVLFNQTVFLFGGAIIAYFALRLRYPENRTRVYLHTAVRRHIVIGVGFLAVIVPVLGFFYTQGRLAEMFYYTVYVPFSSYSTPFNTFQHVLALVTLLPIWILTAVFLGRSGWSLLEGTQVTEERLFITTWAAIMIVPGATAFAGDHKFLMVFPAIALASALALLEGWERYRANLLDVSAIIDTVPSRGTFLTIFFLGTVVVAAGTNAVYASALLDDRLAEDADDAAQIAAHVEGSVFLYPPGNHVFYFSNEIEPVRTWIGPTYSPFLVRDTIAHLQDKEVEYVVVLKSFTNDERSLQAQDQYWAERKRPLVTYINGHYEPSEVTENYVILQREK